jgi:tetratricopeptide (TPR) repeat protein
MKLQPKSGDLADRLSNEYNRQGLALLQEDRFAEAEAAFRKSAAGNPEGAAAPLNNLGVAYFSADQPDKAVGAFRDAVSRDPGNPEAHYNLGLAYLSAGNKVAAYAEFLNLRRLNPELAHQLDYLTNFPERRSEYRDKVLR